MHISMTFGRFMGVSRLIRHPCRALFHTQYSHSNQVQVEFEGRISSCGFQSGDRFVVGDWKRTPFSDERCINVMWAQPNGRRVLLSSNAEVAEFTMSAYAFDSVVAHPAMKMMDQFVDGINSKDLQDSYVKDHGREAHLCGFELTVPDTFKLTMSWQNGLGITLPQAFSRRPEHFVRFVENWVANAVFGTKTYGLTRNGDEELYVLQGIHQLTAATAFKRGDTRDDTGDRWQQQTDSREQDVFEGLGPMTDFTPPAGFGFSDPPKFPCTMQVRSIVSVQTATAPT